MTAAPPEAAARLRWMTRHVGPLVLALLLLVIAAGVAAYSFGLFSSTSANAENTVSTGTMTQVSSSRTRRS